MPDLYVKLPDVWSESNTMSPMLLTVLYFTLIPSTVSVVAVSEVANSKTLAPVKLELGYFVASVSFTSDSSNMSNKGC